MPDGKGGAIDFLRADDKLTGDVVERLKKPIKRGNLQEETASTSQPVLGGFFRETIQKKKPAAAKKVAPTKAPPLKGMEDADEQPRVTARLQELGIEYMRSRTAMAEAKAAEKGLFSALATKMHEAKLAKFWIITDAGDRKWLSLAAGSEKIKLKAAKTPAPRAKKKKKTDATETPAASDAPALHVYWHLHKKSTGCTNNLNAHLPDLLP